MTQSDEYKGLEFFKENITKEENFGTLLNILQFSQVLSSTCKLCLVRKSVSLFIDEVRLELSLHS